MATLTIDDRTYAAITECASARGLSIDGWLRLKAAEDEAETTTHRPRLSREELRARLMAIGDQNPATGVPVDDSRDSIYD